MLAGELPISPSQEMAVCAVPLSIASFEASQHACAKGWTNKYAATECLVRLDAGSVCSVTAERGYWRVS
jgi:hypothetical protein